MRLTQTKILTIILAWTIILVSVSCTQDGKAKYADLEKRIAAYYGYEKEKNWKAAYEYRTPRFRQSVPLDIYLSTMDKDDHGWTLKKFQIMDIKSEGDTVTAKVRFIELAPISILPEQATRANPHLKDLPVEQEIAGDSIWKKINGEWYCIDAVSRGYLSLNSALVPE